MMKGETANRALLGMERAREDDKKDEQKDMTQEMKDVASVRRSVELVGGRTRP